VFLELLAVCYWKQNLAAPENKIFKQSKAPHLIFLPLKPFLQRINLPNCCYCRQILALLFKQEANKKIKPK